MLTRDCFFGLQSLRKQIWNLAIEFPLTYVYRLDEPALPGHHNEALP